MLCLFDYHRLCLPPIHTYGMFDERAKDINCLCMSIELANVCVCEFIHNALCAMCFAGAFYSRCANGIVHGKSLWKSALYFVVVALRSVVLYECMCSCLFFSAPLICHIRYCFCFFFFFCSLMIPLQPFSVR